MKLVIVTGLSGAGKSNVIRCLEDFGFYCVDNMPPALVPKFLDICQQSQGKIDQVAIVIDIRGGDLFKDLTQELNLLRIAGNQYDILFLEASDEMLINRYK